MSDRPQLSRAGLLHLLVVYIVWGSTYLGIRVAVREGSGFPPFYMAASRVFAAAVILFLLARWRGQRLRLTRHELVLMTGSGLLLWVGGNGLVSWAEMRASSGLAALLVAAMPIWAELIAMVIDRRVPHWRAVGSVLVGFAGVGVLTWPVLREGTTGDALAVLALLLAPLFWALGSIWYRRRQSDLSGLAVAGWQQLLGGLGLLACAVGRGEPLPSPTGEAWVAWAYLAVFGSVISFTSYMTALRVLPTRVVMTYPYVNPVIAVFLGWLILREEVTGWTLGGAALVIAGVMGVFRHRD
jgi:drug/metabolite transporter (DMT)-like permease